MAAARPAAGVITRASSLSVTSDLQAKCSLDAVAPYNQHTFFFFLRRRKL